MQSMAKAKGNIKKEFYDDFFTLLVPIKMIHEGQSRNTMKIRDLRYMITTNIQAPCVGSVSS